MRASLRALRLAAGVARLRSRGHRHTPRAAPAARAERGDSSTPPPTARTTTAAARSKARRPRAAGLRAREARRRRALSSTRCSTCSCAARGRRAWRGRRVGRGPERRRRRAPRSRRAPSRTTTARGSTRSSPSATPTPRPRVGRVEGRVRGRRRAALERRRRPRRPLRAQAPALAPAPRAEMRWHAALAPRGEHADDAPSRVTLRGGRRRPRGGGGGGAGAAPPRGRRVRTPRALLVVDATGFSSKLTELDAAARRAGLGAATSSGDVRPLCQREGRTRST